MINVIVTVIQLNLSPGKDWTISAFSMSTAPLYNRANDFIVAAAVTK